MNLRAPFVYFGGKSRVAPLVWERFGADVPNYVEPFCGSGAVLLGRPGDQIGIETVNDIDGYVCNFWRALQRDPDAVTQWADQPVNENDLHARHIWLRQQTDLVARLEADPDYCDVKIAGWWVWGMAVWIGGGFCGPSGAGPWHVETGEDGIKRLVDTGGAGQGVTRRLVHLGGAGQGVTRQNIALRDWMRALADRLRRVRVCCGDWSRVCTLAVTTTHGITAVFLDPPYSTEAGRDMNVYACDDGDVAHDVRRWAIEHGDDPLLRVALCGYEGEHEMPETWERVEWRAQGGMANIGDGAGKENRHRERIYFSPHCLRANQDQLW